MSRAAHANAPKQQPTPAPQPKTIDPDSALLDDIMEKVVSNLDKTAEKFAHQLEDPGIGALRRSFITGMGVKRLREMMDENVMTVLRSLMNTQIGFKTDMPSKKDPQSRPYGDDVLRDCAIEAMLKGVLWIGNQFNILAGRCYLTQEGYTYKLENMDGLSSFAFHPGVPRAIKDAGAVVRCNVSWTYKGVKGQLIDETGKPGVDFAIKTDSTVDQILGKAKRKAYKLAHDTLVGVKNPHDDDDDAIPPVMAPAPLPQGKAPAPSPEDPSVCPDTEEALQSQFGRVGMGQKDQEKFIGRFCSTEGQLTESAALRALKELEGMEDAKPPGAWIDEMPDRSKQPAAV